MTADPRARNEWLSALGAGIAVIGVVDYRRSLGEPDGDTLSEALRDVLRLDEPEGRRALAVALAGVSVGVWMHLCRPGELGRRLAALAGAV